MSGIFISYRRDDSGGFAGRLYDRLRAHFGADDVFRDLDAIRPGLDYAVVIDDAVAKCDALIAVIGKQWATITDDEGHRRIDSPKDFLRLEVETALKRNVPIYPVLLEGAKMPEPEDLPESLQPLARHQALEISDARWDHDVQRLIALILKLTATVEPVTNEARREARYLLTVRNEGTARVTSSIVGIDPSGELSVRVSKSSITVAPGEAATVDVDVKAHKALVSGSPVRRGFTVRVEPSGAPAVEAQAEFVQQPTFERSDASGNAVNVPRWLRVLAAIAGAAAVLIGGGFMESIEFRTPLFMFSAAIAITAFLGLILRSDAALAAAGALGFFGLALFVILYIRLSESIIQSFFEYEVAAGAYVFFFGSLVLMLSGIHARFLPSLPKGWALLPVIGIALITVGGLLWTSGPAFESRSGARVGVSAAIIAITIIGSIMRSPLLHTVAGGAGFIGLPIALAAIADADGIVFKYMLQDGFLDLGVWIFWAGTALILAAGAAQLRPAPSK